MGASLFTLYRFKNNGNLDFGELEKSIVDEFNFQKDIPPHEGTEKVSLN